MRIVLGYTKSAAIGWLIIVYPNKDYPVTEIATLQISLPKDFLALLGAQPQASETAREFIVLGVYQEGHISGGKAAELLGLTKRGFVALLARKGIDYFRLTPDEWADEATIVKTWIDGSNRASL